MPRIYFTSRHTGWQLVFGLRTDLYEKGYAFQSTLGCLDATTSMPAGSVIGVLDTRFPPVRTVKERFVLRSSD